MSTLSYGPLRSLAILSVLFGSFSSTAQQQLTATDPLLFRRDHFSFDIETGVNHMRFHQQTGSDRPGFLLQKRLGFNFGYTFNFTPRYGILVEAGASTQSFGTNIETIGTNEFYDLFYHPAASFVYRLPVNGRHFVQLKAGAGMSGCLFGPKNSNSIQATSVYMQPNGVITGSDYSSVFAHFDSFGVFGILGANISRVLKNNDVLSLGLSCKYYFTPLYTGTYAFHNNTSTGTFENAGPNFLASLGYTFTHGTRVFRMEEARKKGDPWNRVRREMRKEKRFIDPKSTFVHFSGGWFVPLNKVVSSGNTLFAKRSSTSSAVLQFGFEQGLNKNWYAEASYAGMKYIATTQVLHSPVTGIKEVVDAGQLSIGGGKRFIGRNFYNYLNISAGASLNFQSAAKGKGDTLFGYQYTNSGDTLYKFSGNRYIVRNFFPTFYINLSKDFQLSRSLYLSVAYRWQVGLATVAEQRLGYHEQNGPQKQADIAIKGTAHSVQFGLKYRFLTKPHERPVTEK